MQVKNCGPLVCHLLLCDFHRLIHAVFGLTGNFPEYCIIVIGANHGIVGERSSRRW